MSQAKRQKIKYGDPTDYNKSVESGAIIPRTPSKTSDELKADIKKGYLVPRPGQADTHLSHLNFSHEAILNAAALDSQEKIARRYYEANIDMINATRKSAGLAELTVDQAVAAAKAVYDVLNNKGKESDELKKDIEAGVIIYRRLNKDLEEEVLAKDVIGPGGSLSITTTVTSTTTIGTSPAPGSAPSGRVRRSTTEEVPAPETSGSTETTQNGGTPNKKNKGDQSSETVATELPHVAPDHGTTETGNAGEGARPSNGNGGSSVSPSQPEENKGGTEAPAPIQPPAQPEAPVENNPTPEPPVHVETEEEKLAKYTEDDFSGSTGTWYDFEHPETFYNTLPADATMHLERGKTYRLVMWNTNESKAEYVEIKHPKDMFLQHIHANSTDYAIRPQDKPVEGGPYKDVVTADWVQLNELDDNAELHEYTGLLYYTSNEDMIPKFSNNKGLKWYDFDNVSTVYDVDDGNESSHLTNEFKLDMRKADTHEIVFHTMPILAQVFTQKVTYNDKEYWIRPQDNYTDEDHVKDIVMLDASKLLESLANTIGDFNKAHIVVSNRVLRAKTAEETTPGNSEATPTPAPEVDPIIHGKRLSEYNSTNFNRSYVYVNYNEDMSSSDYNDFSYFLTLDAINTPLERGKTYDFAMMNVNTNQIKLIHMDDPYATFTKESKTVSRSNILLRPQDGYVKGDERYIPFLIKEYFDTASTIGDYCNSLAVEPSDSLKPDISEKYFTDHEFHITSVQSEGYCVAKGDENIIPVPGHTYRLYNISTQEAEDVVFPDIRNTYDTVNIGRQKYYYKPEYKVTDPHAVEGDADMYVYLRETIDNSNSTWLDIMISQRRVPRTITYIEPKLPEVTDTIDTAVYYDKPWFSISPYDLSTRLYISKDSISEHPAPQYDKVNIFRVWNAKTNAESKEYISHLGNNTFGPFDIKGESCYVFKSSDDYSTVNNLEDLGIGRNIVTIPAHIIEKININDYQSITWKDILDNIKLIYTGDLY